MIDDDPITNFIQAREIRKAELDVYIQEVTNARDGLDYLRKAGKFADTPFLPHPGLIILDLNMPGMTGWDFMAEYQKLHLKGPKKPCIFILTTSTNPDDQLRAATMPEVTEFMRKPLQADKLREIIERRFIK